MSPSTRRSFTRDAAFAVLAIATGCGSGVARSSSSEGNERSERDERPSFVAARRRTPTRLLVRGPSPQEYEEVVPREARVVHYDSGGLSLMGWLAIPPGGGDRPMVVYAHGGFALGLGDFEDVRAIYDAGIPVFLPAFRGENGNPGNYELAWSELDDLAAAIRHASRLRGVDSRRVFVIGHSSGGMLAALTALLPNLPLALTASIGGVYSPRVIAQFRSFAPFDVNDERECQLRSVLPFASRLARAHVAYVGRDDDAIRSDFEAIERAAARSRGRLEVVNVPGDHHGSIAPALRDFLRRIGE